MGARDINELKLNDLYLHDPRGSALPFVAPCTESRLRVIYYRRTGNNGPSTLSCPSFHAPDVPKASVS
jgi:hypothetical protein